MVRTEGDSPVCSGEVNVVGRLKRQVIIYIVFSYYIVVVSQYVFY